LGDVGNAAAARQVPEHCRKIELKLSTSQRFGFALAVLAG